MKVAIYPGSFDPVTNGHIEILTRASKLFDKVIVVVLVNPKKPTSFTIPEREALLVKATEGLKNIEIDSYNGLLVDYFKTHEVDVIVKGLRAISDFEYEFQMALANKKLYDRAETVFLTSNSEYTFLSSSVVKQIAMFGGDISGFVPECIHDEIKERLSKSTTV